MDMIAVKELSLESTYSLEALFAAEIFIHWQVCSLFWTSRDEMSLCEIQGSVIYGKLKIVWQRT